MNETNGSSGTEARSPEEISYRRITEVTPALLADLETLYRSAGWFGPSDDVQTVKKILEGSFVSFGAFTDKGEMIGFMRALSDGVSDAYMLDLVVAPSRRKQGIGHKVLCVLEDHLRELGLDWIVCIGAPGTESFYAKSEGRTMEGFTPLRFPGGNAVR